ncbi:PIN domain-like protein [Neoconidiobolus thromboides FSU 785]|nr:PIN domain-like protein [Neoconidiobolus thromboides FSU 785]
MGVRNFEVYLADHQLIQTVPLNLLKDCKILVEGHLWLKKILTGSNKESPTVAMGGAPIGLDDYIIKELNYFKSNGIKATFVFTSLTPFKKDRPFSTEDKRPLKRTQAWEAYEKGNSELATSFWNTATSTYQPELLNIVFKTLTENNEDFIRAPYSSWAQIAYISRMGQAHAVLAGTEALLFGVEKLITAINFEKNEFTFIHKSKALQEMQINDDQLLDIAVLAGFDYCSTFPPLASDNNNSIFKSALEMVRHHKTGFNAVQAFTEHPEVARTNYVDNYCRAVCSVKYQPYLSRSGVVEPCNAETAPNDLQTFMGHRLPDEVYYYLSKGLISHHVVSALITGIIVDTQPLCNGFKEYRKLLNDLIEIRSQTLALLTRHLHGFFQSRKVFQGESDIFFAAIAAQSPKFLEIEDSGPIPLLKTVDQILVTTITRFLELRGMLAHPNGTYPYGNALNSAIDGFEDMPNDGMEGLIIALELFKLGLLNNQPYEFEYKDMCTTHIPENELPHARLFSRVVSLITVGYETAPWEGPVDRNLLCFQSCARLVSRSLRHYVEMVAMGIILGGETVKPRTDITKIAQRLPFVQETNTALGVLAKLFLDRVCQYPETDINHWFEPSQLPKTFASCADVQEDLFRGFDFWDQVYSAIITLKGNSKEGDVIVQQFIDANEWLSNKRL